MGGFGGRTLPTAASPSSTSLTLLLGLGAFAESAMIVEEPLGDGRMRSGGSGGCECWKLEAEASCVAMRWGSESMRVAWWESVDGSQRQR